MRFAGTDTPLKSFTVKCWEFVVADSLGQWLNWEGRKDGRIKIPGQPGPGRKLPMSELQLTKTVLRNNNKLFYFYFTMFLFLIISLKVPSKALQDSAVGAAWMKILKSSQRSTWLIQREGKNQEKIESIFLLSFQNQNLFQVELISNKTFSSLISILLYFLKQL